MGMWTARGARPLGLSLGAPGGCAPAHPLPVEAALHGAVSILLRSKHGTSARRAGVRPAANLRRRLSSEQYCNAPANCTVMRGAIPHLCIIGTVGSTRRRAQPSAARSQYPLLPLASCNARSFRYVARWGTGSCVILHPLRTLAKQLAQSIPLHSSGYKTAACSTRGAPYCAAGCWAAGTGQLHVHVQPDAEPDASRAAVSALRCAASAASA